ncbi:chromosome segregation protein Csm1/Pcs1-domain-containing protein [Immersiella caudata]|uniref:Chromosome segregation protein Csm1/Pcs1-domain-containing protein n=1 Tax=Immersiella caudata TaxID=314043 RepID=A0AA40C7E6_9PEZI|nr:chromosome segregation protein Csm1/Pcs1-domain-containing protein [Immersiella caudata]
MAPATKGTRGRQPANKVTKPAQQKKTSTRQLAAAVEKAAEEESRAALAEKSSNAQPKATARGRKKAAPEPEREVEDVVMEDTTTEPAPKPKTARGRPKKAAAAEEVKEPANTTRRAPVGRGQAAKKVAVVIPEEEDMTEIPETQPPGAYPAGSEGEEERDQLEALPASDPMEKIRQIPSSPSKRPLYSSSSEGGSGDPALRRRLGDMTQKYEALEKRHQDLKEVAVREAERNFDRLKKQTDEKAKAAEQLIATLKSEVAAQKEEAKEAIHLKKQLDEISAQTEDYQARATSLTTSLAEAKAEIKSLTMKLSAARAAEAAAVARVVPGSAMKNGHAQQRVQRQEQATLSAQLKEDLYGDLTGLIVRGVKRDGTEDVYDCIQTGRNGTLHFKLAIDVDGAENFEDTQVLYMPQLDPNRDRALIEILPEYLIEEITFPRPQAAKFYARLMKALNE